VAVILCAWYGVAAKITAYHAQECRLGAYCGIARLVDGDNDWGSEGNVVKLDIINGGILYLPVLTLRESKQSYAITPPTLSFVFSHMQQADCIK
jgi:hypothetical protein